MRRIKRSIIKHFNCVPWLIVGVQILRDGNISRWQYGMCSICVLAMIWVYAPNEPKRKSVKEAVPIRISAKEKFGKRSSCETH